MIVHDVTLTVDEGTFRWPGDPVPTMECVCSIAHGDDYNLSLLRASAHVGTHVDAPLHFIDGAPSVDRIPLESLVGEASVLDCVGFGPVDASLLAERTPEGAQRLLIRTRTHGPGDQSAGLTTEAADWIVAQGIRLVGVDGPSVDASTESGFPVHHRLLRHGVVIVENCELQAVRPGAYHLVCAPWKWRGAEAAPARVFLMEV